MSGLILSIKNKTSNQEVILSHEEDRSVPLCSASLQIIAVLSDLRDDRSNGSFVTTAN